MKKQDAILWLKQIPKNNIGKTFLINDIDGTETTIRN